MKTTRTAGIVIIKKTHRGTTDILELNGRFDYEVRDDFARMIAKTTVGTDSTEIEVHMRYVDYIDTAGIGALLLLHEKARDVGKSVSIVGAKGEVKDVLRFLKVGRFFTLR